MYALFFVKYVYSNLSKFSFVPGWASKFDFFSMIFDVAAISMSLTRNPFDIPSTLTRNFSPFNNKLPPIDVISKIIFWKLFFVCLAMAIFSIPKSKLIADDAKTGSFALTKIISPSRFTEL